MPTYRIILSNNVNLPYNENITNLQLEKIDDRGYAWNAYSSASISPIIRHTGNLQQFFTLCGEGYSDVTKRIAQQYLYLYDEDRPNLPKTFLGHMRPHHQHLHPNFVLYAHNAQIDFTQPAYDLSPLWMLPANDAASFLLQHIPADPIIHALHPSNTEIASNDRFTLVHHDTHPFIPVPYIKTTLSNNISNNSTRFYAGDVGALVPLHPKYQQIDLQSTRLHQSGLYGKIFYTISPDTSAPDAIHTIEHHLQHEYINHPRIRAMSQHSIVQIYRYIQQHAPNIAKRIYDTTIQYRAFRLSPPKLGFPIYPDPTK